MRQEIYGNEGWIAGRDIYYCAPGQSLADWDSDSLEQELAWRVEKGRRWERERMCSAPYICARAALACTFFYLLYCAWGCVLKFRAGTWFLAESGYGHVEQLMLLCLLAVTAFCLYWAKLQDERTMYHDRQAKNNSEIHSIRLTLLDRDDAGR